MRSDGPGYAKGDRVRLVKLEDEFYVGIDADDVARLKTLVGRVWKVDGIVEAYGLVELLYKHPPGEVTPLEWVSVPPDWIERIE